MKIAQYCVEALGSALLVLGYVRKRRNLMLADTIVLFLGTGLQGLVSGAMQGWKDAGR